MNMSRKIISASALIIGTVLCLITGYYTVIIPIILVSLFFIHPWIPSIILAVMILIVPFLGLSGPASDDFLAIEGILVALLVIFSILAATFGRKFQNKKR